MNQYVIRIEKVFKRWSFRKRKENLANGWVLLKRQGRHLGYCFNLNKATAFPSVGEAEALALLAAIQTPGWMGKMSVRKFTILPTGDRVTEKI